MKKGGVPLSLTDSCNRLVAEGKATPIRGTGAIEVLVLNSKAAAVGFEELQRKYAEDFDALWEERRRREREAEIKLHREYGHLVFD